MSVIKEKDRNLSTGDDSSHVVYNGNVTQKEDEDAGKGSQQHAVQDIMGATSTEEKLVDIATTCKGEEENAKEDEIMSESSDEEHLMSTLYKEYEAYKSATMDVVSDINRSTSSSNRLSSSTSRGENSIPGAFAVENPFAGISVRQAIVESDNSFAISDNNDNLNPPEPLTTTTTDTFSTVVPLSTSTSMQQPLPHEDAETGQNRIIEAICVDNQKVFEAQVVPSNDSEESRQSRSKKTSVFFITLAIMLLLVMSFSFVILLTRKEEEINSRNIETDVGDTTTDTSTTSMTPSNQLRRDGLRAIVAPLAGDGVFDEKNPEFSADRKSALDWLVRDDMISIDGQTSDWKIIQRYILALLYFSTNGSEWKYDYYFVSGLNECDWSSVKTMEENFFDVADDFDISGVICNRNGEVERIRMLWNHFSGTLPHELSNFSESLIELNIGGGSLSGAIPQSFTKLTNIETLALQDNCLSGSIPDFSDFPNIEVLTLHNNGDLFGSLNGFCNGSELKTPNTTILGDCGMWCTGTSEPLLECDCCNFCCRQDDFKCCNKQGVVTSTLMLDDLSPNDFIPNFDKQCLSETSRQWIREECPCVRNNSTENDDSSFIGMCTKDCNVEGAIRSYDY